MAVLNICSCSECDCEYTFTGIGLGLGKETFAKYRSQITRDIAAGKYGEELRRNMVCPESVYLEWPMSTLSVPGATSCTLAADLPCISTRKANPPISPTTIGLALIIFPAFAQKRTTGKSCYCQHPAGVARVKCSISPLMKKCPAPNVEAL